MKLRRNYPVAIVAFVVLVGLCLGAMLASAADEKLFAPQLCVAVDGEVEVRVDAVEQIDGTGYRVVACPLVRDILVGGLEKVWIWVGNRHLNDQTPPECCVYSISPANDAYDYACALAEVTVGRQTLEIDLADFDEVPQGIYVVTCDLGLGDTIHGIRTREL